MTMTTGMMVRNPAKAVIKRMLSYSTLVLHRVVGVVPAWPFVLRNLRAQGFEPRTVFDIGVAQGTPELYAVFPDSQYYLIDPTRESLPYMERIAKQLDARILNIALGDAEGELEIGVRTNDIGGSTFYEEVGPLGPTRRYPVPVQRFDQAINGFERPALCKIDVQGSEMSVLRGMGERIHDVDAILIEASVIATIHDGPEIAEVVSFLRQRGFVIYDVLGGGRRPLDSALAQLDLLFVKEDSPLRADHRWSATA
ncbi:FkbM family methyltransferase [Vineibacter terrae]|uniref:FkbM family methyltransferase n=1 Tax=Vineibacter terrae TaxID=2586908 RepID=UPI002E31C3DF|nr:FkbM family methyltransferase [Vineibacter terrae]HEX2889960.1 FkbM family methyltransferase [Vineibacter terrae]